MESKSLQFNPLYFAYKEPHCFGEYSISPYSLEIGFSDGTIVFYFGHFKYILL